MAGFKLDVFKGLRPRISATKLGLGEAATALNLKLGSGDLEPIPDKSTVQAVGSNRMSRTIYRFDNDDSPLWFEWDDLVDVVRGPVKDDSIERTYYTGDTTGNGAPKVTTTALADLGNGGPYPESWLYIGVPKPESAPTVVATPLPEEKDATARLAGNFKVDEFVIDRVKWSTYPGTGTRNQTWRAGAANAGTELFNLEVGMAFKVLTVINDNRVTVESATEPGITLRTKQLSNYYLDELGDSDLMDEQGSTQEAWFSGWRVPPGMEITITDHDLNVGDVLVVSSVNDYSVFYYSLTTDFFEQDWDTEKLLSGVAADFYYVADGRISPSAVTGASQWEIPGSFYYDVDRAKSVSSELEDRSYVYTYVNSFGEEGPPSDPSNDVLALDGQEVLVSDMSLPPTIGYDITEMRLYRTNSTEAGTEYQLVKTFDVSVTTLDSVKSIDLQEVIASTTWIAPPTAMSGLITMPNGMLVGFKGKQLYFCEPDAPHAWPAEYDQAVDYNIVGLASFGNSVVAVTKGWPYIVTGSHPRNANVRPIKVNQACVSKGSIATGNDKVYYASPDGLVEISVNGVRIATAPFLDKSDWETYSPSTLVSEFYEGRYYGFYDFDASAVDPVITAEVSGTITDATETNIRVDGGRTIILTLTNDNWVAAGTSFDNQRQNIIDGLTCSTSQTLGWNNVVRDTDLAVGNVVRTSDTVATITLPVSATYAITADEVVQATIPHAALLVGSVAITTSTFTIREDQATATVTLTGTLGGAAESDVVAGGNTIIITLTNDTWQTTLTDAMKQLIIDGLKSATNELDGWNDTVPQEIDVAVVVRTSDTVVTITLPAVANYSVTANETITAAVPHAALVIQEDVPVDSSNSLGILATGGKSALFSGTAVDGGVLESEIVAGAETIIITLVNDTWIAAGTGPIGSTANTEALIAALISQDAPAAGWNAEVLSVVAPADVTRTSPTVCTIILPAIANYVIDSNETVGMTIPAAVLTAAEALLVSNTFGITAQAPITAALTGTATATIDEADVVTGGKTIIITLTNDTWVAAGATFDAQRAAIASGIDSGQAEGTGWDAVVKAGIDVGDVVRTSDTVVTVTLDAEATYDITADETITVTVPAAALTISGGAVVASPTFDVAYIVPTTAALTGTAVDASINQTDVITGNKTIIVTLTNDTWAAAGAAFNAIRQDIIDGLDSAQSEGGGWNAKVRDVMGVGTVVRTSATVVTVTLPATADYVTTANETITVTVPASALVTSAIAVTATPTFDVLAQTADTTAALTGTATDTISEVDIVAGGKTIILTLTNDTWVAAGATFDAQRAAIASGIDSGQAEGTGWDAVVKAGIDVGDVVRTNDTVVTITLDAEATYNITADETITATIPAAALSVGPDAVVASPTFDVAYTVPIATAALTGTVTDANTNEVDIVAGSKTIILTLTDDTWVAAGTAFNAVRQDIIDGLDAAASPAFGWNNEVRDNLAVTAVVRTSSTICTITLSAQAAYEIDADETITATIPISALATNPDPVVASPTFAVEYNAVTLTTAGSDDTQTFPANAASEVLLYNLGTNQGEVWKDISGTLTLHESAIVPTSEVNNYQMKWEALSGDAPDTNTEVENTWYPLSSGNFSVKWTQSSEGNVAGTVTVSIREGTGSVLGTASWSGYAEVLSGE